MLNHFLYSDWVRPFLPFALFMDPSILSKQLDGFGLALILFVLGGWVIGLAHLPYLPVLGWVGLDQYLFWYWAWGSLFLFFGLLRYP